MDSGYTLDIEALKWFLVEVGSYNAELVYNPSELSLIYHYTDLNGLKGIVEDSDLWFTHSRYSNDDEELTHGTQIAREVIDAQGRAPADTAKEQFLNSVRDMLTSTVAMDTYVCCFCEQDDLLSQWRSYSANGTGVSIGFDINRFYEITGPDSPPSVGLVRLWKVFYREATQRDIVKHALDFHWSKLGELSIQQRAKQAVDAIRFFIPTFKSHDFEEEKEMRLILTPFPNCPIRQQFRVARGMLVPYYSLKKLYGMAWRLPIARVRVGPSVNRSLNVESARILLDNSGYTDIPVDSSNTPYRG